MILFKRHHVEPIKNGTKTETRRAWSKMRVLPGSSQKGKTKMLSRDYFALLKIDGCFWQRLGGYDR